jgi:hypothetical protein
VLVSHKHRFIFVKTRKTGGTSVELALAPLCGPDDIITPLKEYRGDTSGIEPRNHRLPEDQWSLRARLRRLLGKRTPNRGTGFFQHMPAADIRRLLGDEIWDSYRTFTIERNPWDRQVSLYHWHYRNSASPPPFRSFVMSPLRRKKSRNWSMYTQDDRLIVDHVITYERLQSGLNEVLDKVGIRDGVELPTAKSGFRTERDYRSYYDDDTRQAVARWYAAEIDAFGFQF